MVIVPFFFKVSILYLAGSSFGIDDNVPWNTVFPDGDPWDVQSSEVDSNTSKEALGNSVFSLLGEDEVLTTTHTPPNWSMIPITSESRELPTAAPIETMSTTGISDSLPVNLEPSESSQVLAEQVSSPKRRSYHNEYSGRLVGIVKKIRQSNRIRNAFKNLKPLIPKPDSLSQEQLENIFLHQENHYLWSEMIDYPLKKYYEYWGQVCDYFWYKSKPEDKRYRGCFITMVVNANTTVRVHFLHFSGINVKAQLLRCSCFYYVLDIKKPDSNETVFAVHKHAANEYFLLDVVSKTKVLFTIANFLTKVFLPTPIN